MKLPLRNLILLVLMLAASGMAVALKPTKKIADQGPKVELETLIPKSFGEWRQEIITTAQVVDPQQKATIDKIYNQTLSRTYVSTQGYRIMLSVAYGGDQSDTMQLHKPEVCYPAQGFSLVSMSKGALATGAGAELPVMRIVAQMGRRTEPLTYWIRAGDTVVRGSVEQNLARIRLGLRGYIPDGLLFRVSEVNPDAQASFELQDRFVRDFLATLAPAARESVIGTAGTR